MILDQAVLQPSPGPKRHSENDGMFVPFGTTRPVMIDAPGDLIATEERGLREGDERRHPVRLADDAPGLALLQTSLEPYVEGAVRLNVRAVTTTIMSYAVCMRSKKTTYADKHSSENASLKDALVVLGRGEAVSW